MAEIFEHRGFTEELRQVGPLQNDGHRHETSIMPVQNVVNSVSIPSSFATPRSKRELQAEECKLVRLREREARNLAKLREREERSLARLREKVQKQALRNQ